MARATSISRKDLAKSVDAAVKLAAKRHGVVAEPGTFIDRWEIIGRRLRGVADFNVAFRFAQEVSKSVKVPGVQVDPVVTRIGRDIFVGFIDRGQLPIEISR